MPSVDKIADAPYDPRLYAPVANLDPLPGVTAVSAEHVDQYRDLGVISVAGVYTPEECQAGIAALLAMADDVPDGVELQFESGAAGADLASPIEVRQDYIRKYMTFIWASPELRAMAHHPNILTIVRRLLGDEPEVYQDMALFKPPGIGREKPWHQDHAYFNVSEETPIVGVWIALDAATLENGCMVFRPGGHKDGVIPHFNRRDWQICDADVLAGGATVAAPLEVGGALFFDGKIPHGTPTNRSPHRRRAMQFHYVPRGTVRTTTEERMALFGSEGRDVSC